MTRRQRVSSAGCAVLMIMSLTLSACEQRGPDLTGVWTQDRGNWPVTDTPYTPAGRAAQNAWNPDQDPILNCIVHFGRVISAPYPVEILHNGARLTLLYENAHQVRRIFMDGRGHPANEPPTVMGHSIGWWEGSTLVVETTNIEAGYLRPEGMPHTDAIVVTERFAPIEDGNTLDVKLTVRDDAYYSSPFVVTRRMRRSPENEILEYNCIVRDYLHTKEQPGSAP